MPTTGAIQAILNMALDMADRVANETEVGQSTAVRFDVVSTSQIAEIENDWRALEGAGIESPGQSYDFIVNWIAGFGIPERDQRFVVARQAGKPIVVMGLHRTRNWGMRVWETIPGGHVGTNAPLIDVAALSAMTDDQRKQLWRAVSDQLVGAQMAYLCCLPEMVGDETGLFDAFGLHVQSDGLHRSIFDSWEQCNAEQRSRSRRKHDKQQGAKLAAMGEVSFEVLDTGADVDDVLATMFQQRADRFAQQGIADPFARADVRAFYKRAFENGGDLTGRLHVLRLNGEIVAVRYNLIHCSRMFCLISSMSVAPEIQPGSPGKQCLLRVMQTEFDNGTTMFDMGSGLTDEKRHWCNVHIPMRHHYLPLTLWGAVIAQAHRAWQRLKIGLKSNARLFGIYKSWRIKMRGRAASKAN